MLLDICLILTFCGSPQKEQTAALRELYKCQDVTIL